MNELMHKIPCDYCAHNKVCMARQTFEETEIKATHPYMKIKVECTEYMNIVPTPRMIKAPFELESEE